MRLRLVVAVVALLLLAQIGSATAEEAYRWSRTTQSAHGWWYTAETGAWGDFHVYGTEQSGGAYYGDFYLYAFDGSNYMDMWCYFSVKGAFVVNADGSNLKNAVLTLDTEQEGVYCSVPMQVNIVFTPSPDTGGLLHSNGSEKIQGHVVVVQTMKRYWGANAAGTVGDLQLPPSSFPEMNAQVELEDWYSMTK